MEEKKLNIPDIEKQTFIVNSTNVDNSGISFEENQKIELSVGNLTDGEKRMISEINDSWLMTILEISGGVQNIPKDVMQQNFHLMSMCEEQFKNFYIKNKENNNINLFWEMWKEEHPEYYNFNRFVDFNPNKEMAQKALEEAIKRFL